MRHHFPDWRLVTKGKHSISLIRDIENGPMDAGFIGLHTDTRSLMVETVREEPLVVALPSNHRLARKRELGFDDLRGEPIFWFERRLNPGFHDYCKAFFEHAGFTPTVIPEPPDHLVLLGLIAEGQGVALIPQSLKNVRRRGVVFRALGNEAKKLSMGIAAAYSDRNDSPVLRSFLELVQAQKSPT